MQKDVASLPMAPAIHCADDPLPERMAWRSHGYAEVGSAAAFRQLGQLLEARENLRHWSGCGSPRPKQGGVDVAGPSMGDPEIADGPTLADGRLRTEFVPDRRRQTIA